MSDPIEAFFKKAGAIFAAPGPHTETPITQPGPGTTVPTESPPGVRLLTPDGTYELDPHKPAAPKSHDVRMLELLGEIRDAIKPKADPYAHKQRTSDPRRGTWRPLGSGTIAAANVAQLALTWRAARRALLIQVPSTQAAGIFFRLDNADANVGQPSIECLPGQTFIWDTEPVPDGAVSVISGTVGIQFTIWEAA